MNKQKELQNCDTVKIVMMVSVILYHSCILWGSQGWFNIIPKTPSVLLKNLTIWLGSIHIYTFTFVSGYLFYFLKYECEKYINFKDSLITRAKRLLIPYMVAIIFWCIPFQFIFFDDGILGILKKYFLATSPSQLWFLIMLFGVFAIYLIISNWFNKISVFKQFIFLLGLFFIYILLKYFNIPNIFQIVSIVRHLVFFGVGFLYRKYNPQFLYNVNYLLLVFINLFILIIYLEVGSKNLLLYNMIYLILNFSGVFLFFIGINKYLGNINKNLKFYKVLKKYNFTMYIFHQQIIYITITLFNNGISNFGLVMVNFIFSFSGSLLISYILSRYQLTKKIFNI